jgi:iron(III) transport system substrate-binding protein
VNTRLVPPDARPDSIHDLLDPRWQGQAGIAKPLFGTTATHAAVLFATWGDDRARQFFDDLRANAKVLGGNKQVAEAVSRGELAFGLTDTDDALIEVEKGNDVEIVFPDQAEGEFGTLFIPNTLCLLKNSPNPENAERLLDYLLSPEVEQRLAEGASAQFPVNPRVKATSRAAPEKPVRWMTVDFQSAADAWDSASDYLKNRFGA